MGLLRESKKCPGNSKAKGNSLSLSNSHFFLVHDDDSDESREFFVCVLLYYDIREAFIIRDKKESRSIGLLRESKKCPGDMKLLEKRA